jgi:hypothetical protein
LLFFVLSGQRRDEEERKARQRDLKKQREKLEKNLPAVIMQMNKAQENERVRKRMKLTLPQPQITDRELELLAKMGYVPETDEDESQGTIEIHFLCLIVCRYFSNLHLL